MQTKQPSKSIVIIGAEIERDRVNLYAKAISQAFSVIDSIPDMQNFPRVETILVDTKSGETLTDFIDNGIAIIREFNPHLLVCVNSQHNALLNGLCSRFATTELTIPNFFIGDYAGEYKTRGHIVRQHLRGACNVTFIDTRKSIDEVAGKIHTHMQIKIAAEGIAHGLSEDLNYKSTDELASTPPD